MTPKLILEKRIQGQENFNVFIDEIENLQKPYSEMHLAIFIYPYFSNNSATGFQISPFEEYSQDISLGQKSLFIELTDSTAKLFGFLLGAIIFLFFYFINPGILISVESIVSIFAAYAIGRDLWSDIEGFLSKLTKYSRIRWERELYSLTRDDYGTIHKYFQYARKARFNAHTLLPQKLDLTKHSSSKLVEMMYNHKDLVNIDSNRARIMSVSFSKEDQKEAATKGYMFAAKVMLTKRFSIVKYNHEYFQALSKDLIGAMGQDQEFIKNKIFVRKTLNIWKLKLYLSSKMLDGELITKQN